MKFLVITSCFAPKNIIGAVRISKIVKYLVREGHSVTVISPSLEKYDKLDNTLECDEFNYVKRILVPYSQLTVYLTSRYKLGTNTNSKILESDDRSKNKTKSCLVTLKKRIYRNLRNIFSIWRDIEWEVKVKKVVDGLEENYDVVLSSYPNAAPHECARYVKRKKKAKIWVADFRDPIVPDDAVLQNRGRLFKKQARYVKYSDITTFISKVGCVKFACYPEDKKKIVWITNGYDFDDLNILDTDFPVIKSVKPKVVFSYAGGLYGGERDCSPLFKALRELIDRNEITLDDVTLWYAGRDIDVILRQAKTYDMETIIENWGLISRTDSINMQVSSDCVIVATDCYQDNGGAMTGKIYEPILMKKPILLLVNGPGRNSEPATFIKDLNAGVVYEKGTHKNNVAVIKAMIKDYYYAKQNNQKIISNIDESKRDHYNYQVIVQELISAINDIM